MAFARKSGLLPYRERTYIFRVPLTTTNTTTRPVQNKKEFIF